MTKITMKPLTESSWLLMENGERVGLVSKKDAGYRVMGGKFPGSYDDLSSMERRAGGRITLERMPDPEPEKEQGLIDGYPVKHGEWHNTMIEPVPSYTRTQKSTNRYGAGYYALRFSHGWTAAFCPKLSTLTEYEYIGPFRTKLEMQHQISAKNKSINV